MVLMVFSDQITFRDQIVQFFNVLTACLFQLFQSKSHVLKKPTQRVRLASIKRNFLVKVACYTCEENAQDDYGTLQVHFQKASVRFHISVGVSWATIKLPFNKSCSCVCSPRTAEPFDKLIATKTPKNSV